jgi:hypothetical protein
MSYNYDMVEEKKTDDVRVSSPLESPSSSSSSRSLKKGELQKILNSSLSSLIDEDENELSPPLSPPLTRQHRNVSFTGIGDSPAPSVTNTPVGASKEERLERELKRLRKKMTEVQIDYQAEKATRKRKEKNLVKLAKELNKRTAEIDFKDSQIKRVRILYFFHSFLRALHSRKPFSLRCILSVLLTSLQLADTVNKMEEQSLATGNNASGHDHELAEAQQEYRTACREYDARLEAIQQEHDETCRELYGQIKEANKQVHNLRNELGPPSPRVQSKKSLKPSQLNGMPKSLVVVGFVVAVLMAVLSQLDLLSMDAVCAPVMPGTTLDTKDAVFEAPWWAPPLQKESAFGAICGGRTRSRLVVSGGKLTASSLLGNDSSAVLWNKRVAATRVGSRRLTLRDNKGHTEHVESPWLL